MSFFKRKRKTFFIILCSTFFILQQLAVWYGRSYRLKSEKQTMYEASQLKNAWRKAAVNNLVTPEKIANHGELKQARIRLKNFELKMNECEKRVNESCGKKRELSQKVFAYYRHLTSALLDMIDFLLDRENKYSVNRNEIHFASENDGNHFRQLIQQLNYLHREKQEFDAFIAEQNTASTS